MNVLTVAALLSCVFLIAQANSVQSEPEFAAAEERDAQFGANLDEEPGYRQALNLRGYRVKRGCLANWAHCKPDGSLGNCCSGYCDKPADWAVGNCK